MPKRLISDSPLRRALSTTEPGQVKAFPDAVLIPINWLHPDPDQPRTVMDQARLEELAESIKVHGVLQPILVRQAGDGYAIVAGHRRYEAARMAGMKTMPCLLRERDDTETREQALVENLQRADLEPLDEALALKRLMEQHGYTIRRLGERLHKSVGYIHARLELAGNADVADAVQRLNVGVYAARELSKVGQAQRQALIGRVAAGELDDQGLVAAARAARSGSEGSESLAARVPWTALRRALDKLDPSVLTPAQQVRARRELVGLRKQIEDLMEALS